jgi:hypothetical protein
MAGTSCRLSSCSGCSLSDATQLRLRLARPQAPNGDLNVEGLRQGWLIAIVCERTGAIC